MIVSARQRSPSCGRRSEPSNRMLFGLVSMLPDLSSAARVESETFCDCTCALIMKSTKLSSDQKTTKPARPSSTRFHVRRFHHGSEGGPGGTRGASGSRGGGG